MQFLNGWGETVANINERVIADHPSGQFAVCLKGSNVAIPTDARRLYLPVKYVRVLARVELGADWDGAIALQHQFTFKASGTPTLPDIPVTPILEADALPGAEAFEAAEPALYSEADINPGMDAIQAKTRAIAKSVKDPAERARIDGLIRGKAFSDFQKALPIIGHGTFGNHWALPSTSGVYGDDWLTRTLVNYGGIWANVREEVVYFKGFLDGASEQLHSDHVYTLTFPKDELPARYAKYFWSVIAVDSVNRRVLPNALKRYLLNNQSGGQYGTDGSLTLYFAAEKPADAPDANWLPTPKGQAYNLTLRYYGPIGGVADRTYYPPPIVKRG